MKPAAGQLWRTPNGKNIRLVKEVVQSADSTWLAIILPEKTSTALPARFEKVAVMARYLRGCALIQDH